MPRRTTIGSAVAVAVLLCAHGAGAQAPPPVTVDVMVGTATIDRTASGLSASATVVSRAAEIALKSALGPRVTSHAPSAIALRLAKLALLDVPITHFTAGLNHEVGHMMWARGDGTHLGFRLTGGPWSSNVFDLRCADPSARLGLGTYGGGFDAEFLLERRAWERIAQEGRGGVNDAVYLLDGAVGRFYYIQQSLSQATGWISQDLREGTGDPTRYVYRFVQDRDGFVTRGSVLAAAGSVRRRAWLNFADFGLWGQALNLARYVAFGQESSAPGWLNARGIGLSPFARYHLSPAGPQTEVGTRYRFGRSVGDVSLRWTEPAGGARLMGTSIAWARTGGRLIDPHVRADFWRDVTRKPGVRLEAGMTASHWPSARAGVQLAVGAKTGGYVLGLPKQATVYAETGLRLRF